MADSLRVVLAQMNPLVGDVLNNIAKIVDMATRAHHELGANLVVFPELAVTGYPPEDLLFRQDFQARVDAGLTLLAQKMTDVAILVGHPATENNIRFNAATLIADGICQQTYYKQQLPNYGVFDEQRYFQAGQLPSVFELNGFKLGITICEDTWFNAPTAQAVKAGAELMVNINASPFQQDKMALRFHEVQQRALENSVPVLYVNQVGAQDELVFDGGSFAVDATGQCVAQGIVFDEQLLPIDIQRKAGKLSVYGDFATPQPNIAVVYQALVTGLRDYIEKNRFSSVVLGLSGGIDSALTLAIAVDAIGAERVSTVMMPSRYTAQISLDDAADMANRLNVSYQVLSIEPLFEQFLSTLQPCFAGKSVDITEENIQARCRGVLLMALSNKQGSLVLVTGNKSELAVGYSTLYGDMAGGFAPIKDVYKTLVFELARYRNTLNPIIPERIIVRPPSAELRADQLDEDSLPPYDILDVIIENYVGLEHSAEALVEQGFDAQVVAQITKMIDRNEYKRRQAAPGTRITHRAFGKDRRYPITSGYHRT